MVLGDSFLLTVHGTSGTRAGTHHLRGAGLDTVMKRGADHLLWALADDLVDGYFRRMDKQGDEIDEIEDEVVGPPRPMTAGASSSSSASSSRPPGVSA